MRRLFGSTQEERDEMARNRAAEELAEMERIKAEAEAKAAAEKEDTKEYIALLPLSDCSDNGIGQYAVCIGRDALIDVVVGDVSRLIEEAEDFEIPYESLVDVFNKAFILVRRDDGSYVKTGYTTFIQKYIYKHDYECRYMSFDDAWELLLNAANEKDEHSNDPEPEFNDISECADITNDANWAGK